MPLNRLTTRPGLMIFIGVVVIAIVLAVVVLIPLPSADRELNSYIPRGATALSRSSGQTLSAVTLTTTQDVAGVIDFYRKKLGLPRHLSPRSGMMIMNRGRLFGGHYTDAILPLPGGAGQAMTITHREARHVAVITVERGTNESLTYLTVVLERLPEGESWWRPTNTALAFPPPQGILGASGTGLGVAVAEFSTGAPFEDVARHYATSLLSFPANQPVPRELRLGDSGDAGLLLRQRRDTAESILLMKPRGRESIYIFCFRDNASTNTQVSVSWVSK